MTIICNKKVVKKLYVLQVLTLLFLTWIEIYHKDDYSIYV